jgi:lysylphosphatidylglycerol synthetase-like protein (DUF2156 family)
MSSRLIVGEEARALTLKQKWELFSPFLTQFGNLSLSYATLQEGMEYFLHDTGYISFTTVRHPVFARKPKRIALSDPVCDPAHLRQLMEAFLASNRSAVFVCASEGCAEQLRTMGFKVNCLGFEPEIPIQTYNTQGNWKELDMIKRARNEARREKIRITEVDIETLDKAQLQSISQKWLGTKKVNDREIWIYARRPVYGAEPDVRKFAAYDQHNQIVGYVFYDPIYRAGKVVGYSANISRCDEQRYGRLATAVHMEACDIFRAEGKEVLSLLLAPFVRLDEGRFNDDFSTKLFFQLSERFGNDIYNFKGLSFHKSKYRVPEKFLYFASNSLMPSNDVYLAFLSSDITRSYFSTLMQLLRGIAKEVFRKRKDSADSQKESART